MATLDVRTSAGATSGTVDIDDALFGVVPNIPVMHQVVTAQLAAKRSGTQSTKTRTEVSGGGAKPWRQKGTGRARQGSIRSPQWVGGGVSHGPVARDHSVRVNKKMKRAARRSALSDALASGKLAVLDALSFDGPKTKEAAGLLDALELRGKVLVVIGEPDEAVEKSFRNLPFVKIDYPGNLST